MERSMWQASRGINGNRTFLRQNAVETISQDYLEFKGLA